MRMHPMRMRGFTFVELVMTIVVIGVAVTGVLTLFTNVVSKSADPMIAHQGVAVAEAYMEEILTKNFTGVSPACTSRATYNAVDCYFGLVEPPTRQSGDPIAGLSSYTVAVSDGGNCGLGLAADEQRIDVAVTHGSDFSYTLSGCMTNY